MQGHLIAFEGLDQSGKQTQAEHLLARLSAAGRRVELVSFPDYATHIGQELASALKGERDYGPDVMQLLYVANRYERRQALEARLADGWILVADRYLASSVAYGAAFGLDAAWLLEIQRFLPRPSLTIMLDIAPETAVRRKSTGRDRYERDLALQERVRTNYRSLAAREGWLLLDGERDRDVIASEIFSQVSSRLGLR